MNFGKTVSLDNNYWTAAIRQFYTPNSRRKCHGYSYCQIWIKIYLCTAWNKV